MNQDTQRSDDRKELIDTFKRIHDEQGVVYIRVPELETYALVCALGDAASMMADKGYPASEAALLALQDMIRTQLEN